MTDTLARWNRIRSKGDGLTCTVDDLHKLVEAGETFATLYADPPWDYGNQATRAATGNHYESVSVDWLCDPANMPIRQLAAEEAHLHLWTTNAFLFEARTIIEAWGFEYKSCFVWVKTQMGIGNYWRVSHEFLLLGIRGGLRFQAKNEKSWAELRRGKHSVKPAAVRQKIERVSLPARLELFGREAVEGWTVWGNEISRDLLTLEIPSGP
jgi:N6-adenosine-specific RNA methylase IME4